MVLRIALPAPEIARHRWPEPDLSGHEALVRREWGLAAWGWMAAWCPKTLAAMEDPVAHFTAMDDRLTAEQLRVREATPLLRGETPGEFQFRVSDLVEAKARAERPPPEVERPVWDREWSDVIRYRHPLERGPDGKWLGGRQERCVTTLGRLAAEMLGMWTQADDARTHLVAPSVMQSILDRMEPLSRHLVWDAAARKARKVHPTDPEYQQLRNYPSPPY